MIKHLFRLCHIPLMLLLTACASQYSISERELERYLDKELHFEVKQGDGVFGIEMKVNDIQVQLGEKPDIMAVTATTGIVLKNPLFPFRTRLETRFEAEPWYDKSSHSIYLRQLELVEVKSYPKEIGQTIEGLVPQLMQYIRGFLASKPVYVLDTKAGNEALLAKMTDKIMVKPGKLVVVFEP